ncbi:MAG: sulfate/molybdate ABC transporter ATP-binding protein [Cellvibrionales bacterium]|mgnify:CR=1 FL=1|nr:sulfate/molybdate ABC transporter ATP-binding protein [Cellvibrionales bacterium]
MSIEIRNVSKQFGNFRALENVSLDVPTGELVALLGPSGCGKTSLLRIIAGMETPNIGSIYFHGADTTHADVRERQVGFVFQHYALFRHMTVFENVAFGLRVRPKKTRPSEAEIHRRVHELLSLVQLDWLANRYPPQLSGGQRQRIALARALAVEPKVLLLDEPFGALDANVRKELRRWLRRLHDELHITSVFVTHDQEEALEVADRIVVMNKGKIEQIGTPEQIYDEPASPFVYQFIGNVNLFHSRVRDGFARIGASEIPVEEHAHVEDAHATAYVRPHDIEIQREPGNNAAFRVKVVHIHTIGSVVHLELHSEDESEVIEAELSRERFRELSLQNGERVWVRPLTARVFLAENTHA